MKQLDLKKTSKVVPMPDGSILALVSHEQLESEDEKRRNVFKTDSMGRIHWQIGDYVSMPSLSTFTNIEVQNEEILAFNFDGGMYRVDTSSGVIIASVFIK
jgi:hypothetical protein